MPRFIERFKQLAVASMVVSSVQATLGSTLISNEGFESTPSFWSNSQFTDTHDWQIDSLGTPSSGTGPSTGADNSANYLYLETSSGYAYSNGNAAYYESALIDLEDIRLKFKYHMYGSDIGKLSVDVFDGTDWTFGAWSVSGHQHTSNSSPYTPVEVDLSSYSVKKIRFRANAVGGYRGDMALDDIEVWSGSEQNFAPAFESDPFSTLSAFQDFEYQENLADYATDLNGDAITFSKVSGPEWLLVSADGALNGIPTNADIGLNTFVVSASDGTLSSQAALEIYVNDNTVPVPIAWETFESGFTQWTNTTSGDTHQWTRNSGSTPSNSTGPDGGAEDSLFYAYLETSSGYAYTAGDTAILMGPPMTTTDNIVLRFDYHMYGGSIGTLAVDVLSQGTWIDNVWTVSDSQHTSHEDAYSKAEIDLGNYVVEQTRIRAIAKGGWQGDIAIDNLELLVKPVITTPMAPVFSADPLVKPSAARGLAYENSIQADASDANEDDLTFSKVSGPSWLNVAADGSLSGIPGSEDAGTNNFIVSVSDGSLSDSATLTIEVIDAVFSTSIYPTKAAHGVDGGSSHGWKVDGVIDEVIQRSAYQDHVTVRRYTSLDFTKFMALWGAYEFKLPQTLLDNISNAVIDSAVIEIDTAGSPSGQINIHGYVGNGVISLSDFSQDNLLVQNISPSSKITIDVTNYANSILGQGSYLGLLLKPGDFDMMVQLWNGTPHPAFGRISGQIARLKLDYFIE